jgi:hypothetical protein
MGLRPSLGAQALLSGRRLRSAKAETPVAPVGDSGLGGRRLRSRRAETPGCSGRRLRSWRSRADSPFVLRPFSDWGPGACAGGVRELLRGGRRLRSAGPETPVLQGGDSGLERRRLRPSSFSTCLLRLQLHFLSSPSVWVFLGFVPDDK